MAKRKIQPPKRGKKKATPIRKTPTVYQRAIKKFTKINNELPEGFKIAYKKRQKIVSENILKKFKDVPKSKIRQKDIAQQIENEIQRQLFNNRVIEECNLAVASTILPDWMRQPITYFNLDYYLSQVAPRCIYVKISAGPFGETDIFFSMNYGYYQPQPEFSVRDIVTNIRNWIESDYDFAKFVPVPKLKPGANNDGEANSYYLDLVLVASGGEEIIGGDIDPVIYEPISKEEKKIFRSRVSKLKRSVNRRDLRMKKKKKDKIKPRKK